MTGRFWWVEAEGRRHATADDMPRPGTPITTLCGQDTTAEAWHAWPFPTCIRCEDTWREIEGLPSVAQIIAAVGNR